MDHTVDIQVRERERRDCGVKAGTEVWVVPGFAAVQFDLQHSGRVLGARGTQGRSLTASANAVVQ